MSEVFLSYKRDAEGGPADGNRAEVVRSRLGALGIDVFIDHASLLTGADFTQKIAEEIAATKAVLVLWTPDSIKSRWVKGEALLALDRDILVAAFFTGIDPQRLPPPFNTVNCSDLTDWIETGASAGHPGWQATLVALGGHLKRPSIPVLAKVLEAKGAAAEVARAEFVRDHSKDFAAERFRRELETISSARNEFESRISSEQAKFDRRNRESAIETRRRVEHYRREFKTRVEAYFQNGGEFWPPDPQEPFQDRHAHLRTQIQVLRAANEEHQTRATQAEDLAKTLAEENGHLKSLLSVLEGKPGISHQDAEQLRGQLENVLGLIREKNQALASAEKNLAILRAENARHESEIQDQEAETLDAVSQLEADLADRTKEIAALRSELGEAQRLAGELDKKLIEARRSTGVPSHDPRPPRIKAILAAVGAMLVGLVVGPLVYAHAIAPVPADLGEASSRISSLTAERGKLSRAVAELTQSNAALKVEADSASRLKRDGEVLRKQIVDLTKEVSDLKKKQDQGSPKEEALRKCDDMTAFQFDPDRPTNTGWKESHAGIDATGAWQICQDALKFASDRPSERRIRLQIGRIFAASGRSMAMSGNFDQAESAFKQAVAQWELAAAADSSHAHNVLGNFHQGLLSIANTPKGRFDIPKVKDLSLAWTHYNTAANLGNPIALGTVGFGLMFPDWGDWKAIVQKSDENERKGREYLEKASRSEYPRVPYFIGLAMREGRGGYPKEPRSAEALIALSYCKRDSAAEGFYVRHPSVPRPLC